MKPTELTQLKKKLARIEKENARLAKDLARLTDRFNEIKQCIGVEHPDDPAKGQPTLSLRCSIIALYNPDKLNHIAGMLGVSEGGPYLHLNGTDQKARVILNAEDNLGRLQLLGKKAKAGVDLWLKEPGGHGHVAVFQEGNSRALLKSCDDGMGAVSVVHDDGLPRAGMTGSEHDGGRVFTVTPDMHMGVQLTSGGPGSGTVIVNHPNGKPGVVLGCAGKLGLVMVNDAGGNLLASLPNPKEESEE